jgi:hypothetical protein
LNERLSHEKGKREVALKAKIMYTHVSKGKNDEIKKNLKEY